MNIKLFFAISAAIGIILSMSTSKKNQSKLSELTLQNIEALENDEYYYEDIICIGDGEVTCPATGRKVAYYFKRYNLNKK